MVVSSLPQKTYLPLLLFLLLKPNQLDIKHQGRLWWNPRRGTRISVSVIATNDEFGLFANFHAGKPLVPSADDLTGPYGEFEGLASVSGGVELRAVRFECS